LPTGPPGPQARFSSSGVALPLEKQRACVYRLGQRKLVLQLRSGRLVVRDQGKLVDFLEYLAKAPL